MHHLLFAAPLHEDASLRQDRPAAGTAAAREELGELRGEVIETEMATEKHAGSGLQDADVTRQEPTISRKNPECTFYETADQWLLRHLAGAGSAARRAGTHAPAPQACSTASRHVFQPSLARI